jgi:hypothetical protein
MWNREAYGLLLFSRSTGAGKAKPQGLKPSLGPSLTARLKPCPSCSEFFPQPVEPGATNRGVRTPTLQPRAEKMTGGSANPELIGASTKIARVNLRGTQVLKAVEARELGSNPGRRKEKLEGLACFLNP